MGALRSVPLVHGRAGVPALKPVRVAADLLSWGRYPAAVQTVYARDWCDDPLPMPERGMSLLARGMGRSYGDSCLNAGNAVALTRGMNRLIDFDPVEGVVACEAGMTLDELIRFALPRGWFPAVTPGTRFVTLGGCVANDVHGKNHHKVGSFGNFVEALELVRSGGHRVVCSPGQPLFEATVGGLGLTGLINWVRLRLMPVRNRWIDMESIRFGGLDEFLALSRESEEKYQYLVAWVDTVARLRDRTHP